MSLRQNIHEELDFQDLTVKEPSAKADVAKGALEMYLGVRESMPPADVAVRIAAALGISVEYLVTGSENRHKMTLASLSPGLRSLIQAVESLSEGDQKLVLKNALYLTEELKKREAPHKV
jgi:hypothetical protein